MKQNGIEGRKRSRRCCFSAELAAGLLCRSDIRVGSRQSSSRLLCGTGRDTPAKARWADILPFAERACG